MLLTDNHLTCVVGIDIHFTTLPPYNPFHPYIGIVIDPADYIPFIGTDVHVNGFKRGNSDTGGIIIPLVHIPLFTPPWLMTPIIGHESMNFFASEKTYSDGTRLSPKGYMLMTCNDIGIPLSLSIGKTKIGKKMLPFAPTLFAPTSFSLPIPTGKPVMVGGPYVPDWAGMLTGLVMSIGFSTLLKHGRKLFKKTHIDADEILPNGVKRNSAGKLIDSKTGRFVIDPNKKPKANKKPKYNRNITERKKALMRDANDPNSGLSNRARKQIIDSKGNKVPKGYEVSHEKPLYNARTEEGKKALDKMDNMKTEQKAKHRKRHKECGNQYHEFGPANKPKFYFDDIQF